MALKTAAGNKGQRAENGTTALALRVRRQTTESAIPGTSAELAPLARILSREQRVYHDLLEIAQQESLAIVEARLVELKDVVERKHEVLARLAALEDRRVAWVKAYAQRRAVDPQALTLALIIAGADPPDRDILTALHEGLTHRIEQIRVLNQNTRALLEAILGSIDNSLRYLLADDGAGQMYGSQGALAMGPVAARRLFDRQA